MSIDRDLLWKAWPSGRLEMRGVSTVGGHLYWGNGYWLTDPGDQGEPGYGLSTVCRIASNDDYVLQDGQYLPNVDPLDHATWACLCYDLLKAAKGDLADIWPPVGWAWSHEYCYGRERNIWTLTAFHDSSRLHHEFPAIETDDGALALVLARIQLREEKEAQR